MAFQYLDLHVAIFRLRHVFHAAQLQGELAREFGAVYIPLDGLFAAAAMKAPCSVWCADGVHPTQAGHALIASAWLDAVLE